jgi:MscS family membrane protein
MHSNRQGVLLLMRAAGLIAITCFLVTVLLMAASSSVSQSSLPNPLAPVATDSPRATLTGLLQELGAAQKLMRATYEQHIQEPGWFMSKQTADAQDVIQAHLERIARAMDLSDVPPAERRKTAIETGMLLSEIFDRVGLPPTAAIPDATGLKALTDKGDRPQWTVPGTEIRIAKIDSGARAGEYLFSADTVARAYEFYQKIRSVPPPDGFDFYAFYALSPGELVPPKWYVYVQKLPVWFHNVYGDSARWQWIALGLTIFAAISFIFAIYRLSRPRHYLAAHLPRWVISLSLPLAVTVTIFLAAAFIEVLNFTGPVYRVLTAALQIMLYVPLTWLIIVICDRLADWIGLAWGAQRYSFDSGIVRVSIRLFGVVFAIGMFAYGASQIGVPLVGILAGLGVGGLAFALAAQPTLENFIGGIMIYADRPVRVGDSGKFGDVTGTIEEIGIRSTRIRLPDRSVMTIPNGDFSKSRLTNFSNRDRALYTSTIGLGYGMKEKELRTLMNNVKKMLSQHTGFRPDKVSVRFSGFGSDSLTVDISGEIAPGKADEQSAIREDINFKLFNIVEKLGAKLTSHG